MRNLYNKDHYVKIVYRIQKLKPDQVALRGNLNVCNMLGHCANQVRMANEAATIPVKAPYLKQQLFKLTFLRFNLNVPKKLYVSSNPSVEGMASSSGFESEKHKLLEQLQIFTALPANYNYPPHWAIGKMSRDNWGKFFWKYLDFHLSQFDV